jgi:hypothetical protein
MQGHMNRTGLAAVAAIAALALVLGVAAAVGAADPGKVAPLSATETLPGDTGTPFWPHETGALVGTSETYADVREDGSYYDPSLGRRVSAAGAVAPIARAIRLQARTQSDAHERRGS